MPCIRSLSLSLNWLPCILPWYPPSTRSSRVHTGTIWYHGTHGTVYMCTYVRVLGPCVQYTTSSYSIAILLNFLIGKGKRALRVNRDCLCRPSTNRDRGRPPYIRLVEIYAKCETILYRRSCKLAWEITSFLQIAWLLYHGLTMAVPMVRTVHEDVPNGTRVPLMVP